MNEKKRVFEDVQATRTSVPLMVGLVGPSGGGKTYSALRLATGFQRVDGGEIYFVDTEARRALHYADRFKFRHVVFGSPFGPLDYLAAIQHCVSKGAKTIIVDSMSHEHEGPGGVLEMHEAEVHRLGGQDRHNFPAWAKPKAERRRMINSLLQQPCNFIFCFRAKEKTKPKGGKLEELGFMPIAGEEFVYEMTLNALLLPNAGGVPTWVSDFTGERQMIKLPEQFRKQLIDSKQPLSEDTGEMLARWASGSGQPVSAQKSGKPIGSKPAADSNTLTFSPNYTAELAGKPIESASMAQIGEYSAYLQGILDDGTKSKIHAQVQKHKDAVDLLCEQILAEEAMSGGASDEAAA
jgi:ABC-type dipeptide/oligopeptide/nickel transport system ATPase subunit